MDNELTIFPSDIWNNIFSFISYEDMVKSGSHNLFDLIRALKRQYNTVSIIQYVYLMIKKEKTIYLPLEIYDKIWKKIPITHQKYLYLTLEIIEKYKKKWNWYYLSQNLCLTPEIIEKYKNK